MQHSTLLKFYEIMKCKEHPKIAQLTEAEVV